MKARPRGNDGHGRRGRREIPTLDPTQHSHLGQERCARLSWQQRWEDKMEDSKLAWPSIHEKLFNDHAVETRETTCWEIQRPKCGSVRF
ncbi:hypothetical protein NQZ68_000024 [Dissostichus eleginoides]|nr:hypothetical protein NQZ68_000024 [Dissostichus eleginoides]